MNQKLSPNAKKGILIAIFVILAAMAVYYVFFGRKQSAPISEDASTLEIVETEEASESAPAEESETEVPTEEPAEESTEAPTEKPTEKPTVKPTEKPTVTPTEKPTEKPTEPPTVKPTEKPTEPPTVKPTEKPTDPPIDRNGQYTDKDNVALYLHTYGKLPSNYITKSQADAIGNWRKQGYYIGGDRFGNREGLLPKKNGRQYYECDISYTSSSNRGSRRIVYSNDGLIYYTDDHYETFTRLY